MNGIPKFAVSVSELPVSDIRYSICTLVTRPDEYAEMVDSFIKAGFDPSDCEYLYVANTDGNHHDAYSGGNLFLQAAHGQYIILCHQDILLKYDRREDLDRRISELDAITPDWGLLGNAGGVRPGFKALRITHSTGMEQSGRLPARVFSLDENFILIKRSANLCLSRDLQGFHFSGTDLCRIAQVVGWTAWAIDFHLYHKSHGNCNDAFYEVRKQLVNKYRSALRGSVIQTTCTQVCLTGSRLAIRCLTLGERQEKFRRIYYLQKKAKCEGNALIAADAKRLRRELGTGWYGWLWGVHKICRPLQNLKRSLSKHFLWQ